MRQAVRILPTSIFLAAVDSNHLDAVHFANNYYEEIKNK
jgi:hypothetical protein